MSRWMCSNELCWKYGAVAAYRYVVESVVGCEPISLFIGTERRTHVHDVETGTTGIDDRRKREIGVVAEIDCGRSSLG